jgi:hypothetical protein
MRAQKRCTWKGGQTETSWPDPRSENEAGHSGSNKTNNKCVGRPLDQLHGCVNMYQTIRANRRESIEPSRERGAVPSAAAPPRRVPPQPWNCRSCVSDAMKARRPDRPVAVPGSEPAPARRSPAGRGGTSRGSPGPAATRRSHCSGRPTRTCRRSCCRRARAPCLRAL